MPSSASSSRVSSPLSLHAALPISVRRPGRPRHRGGVHPAGARRVAPGRGRPEVPRLLHDRRDDHRRGRARGAGDERDAQPGLLDARSEEHTSELQSPCKLVCRLLPPRPASPPRFPYTPLFRSLFAVLVGLGIAAGSIPRAPGEWLPAEAAQKFLVYFMIAVTIIVVAVPEGLAMSVTLSLAYSMRDRKSTRLNSSHLVSSYAVFCLLVPRLLPAFPTRRSSDLCSPSWSASASRRGPSRGRPASGSRPRPPRSSSSTS